MQSKLSILTFLGSETLTTSLREKLADTHYVLIECHTEHEVITYVEQHKQQIDCLILEERQVIRQIAYELCKQSMLLPTIIVCETGHRETDHKIDYSDPNFSDPTHPPYHHNHAPNLTCIEPDGSQSDPLSSPTDQAIPTTAQYYHTAEVHMAANQVDYVGRFINQAIAQFLNLSPTCLVSTSPAPQEVESHAQTFIRQQQNRLSEKLKERLGYLGVYYKRDSKNFFRHLSSNEKSRLLQELKSTYRHIVLNYFSNQSEVNAKIDELVNLTFFADIPVTQIVEIHMELMDEFAHQLKLEGRGEEVLLDYRLTLIDTIAHLCEMYRRSIPPDS